MASRIASAAARTDQITHRVNHLAELDLPWPAPASGLGHQRRDRLPFLIRQVGRIALRLLGDLGHPAAALLGPHPELESYLTASWNPFPNGLSSEAPSTRAASAVLGALAAATQDGDMAAAKLHTLAPAEHRCRSTFDR